MEISTSTWMMTAFIAGMIVSIWKMYPFLVNRTLEDDDTGEDAHNYLIELMQKVLKEEETAPDAKTLHEKMTAHADFDKERFWRFNLNKLNQLLFTHYAQHPHLSSIEDIHQEVNKETKKN
ncbi:hypothetical protein [Sulfurimonas paralvinellae]|uniref:Uncharacterized protein n=1 Tax=Sulfurimonas paralvinellae TaxID=317658 RepID=A0A7M1B9C5_9BACT|nr:hypothetical protein [Sulfurimonas paralvinellae]QOP46241.1 hypothetical protein FM071_08025 [Sulfurimonas paralvinellae]